MRFKYNNERIRIKTFFAFCPIMCQNEETKEIETRWLEYVTVEQHRDHYGWLNMMFKKND